jgi:DNA-binding NarL/FixJ family response regulator
LAAPLRVYLLDDVLAIRVLLRVVLEAEGLEIAGEAGDGEAGVEGIAACQPDVVVLDLSMPKLDGLEAIPLIHERSPRSEIVVYSGFSRSILAEAALARKASHYVEKGEPIEAVVRAVREAGAAAVAR